MKGVGVNRVMATTSSLKSKSGVSDSPGSSRVIRILKIAYDPNPPYIYPLSSTSTMLPKALYCETCNKLYGNKNYCVHIKTFLKTLKTLKNK